MTRTIHYHYHRPGRGETVFEERLVVELPDAKVTLLEVYDGREVRTEDTVILQTGAPIVWFVFPGMWHDIGRFHLADDTFTGWYTNLCTPVELRRDHWRCTDLFLDLWQPAGGGVPRWLDEDEFADAVSRGLLDGAVTGRAMEERIAIDEQVAAGKWPPALARKIDLAVARSGAG